MNLRTALRVQAGDVVSFVGAGGKTTTMYRLAHELEAARLKVVTTTTTKIGAPSTEQTRSFVVESDRAALLARVNGALQEHSHVTVAHTPYAEGKFLGIPPEWIEALRTLPQVQAVLVEADGARKLPFKAPREGEPVVPQETTVLVSCAGMSAIGAPLDEDHVCRADVVSRLSGLALDEAVDIETMARILAHSDGGLKERPAQARAVALLNQADSEARIGAARQVAAALQRGRAFDEVLIGATATADPIIERIGRVSAVIMAAGAGTRFGAIKQLAPWGAYTMIEHIMRLVVDSQADEVTVVLGAHAEQIRRHLPPLDAKTQVVLNPAWQQGMSTSVRAGICQSRITPSATIFINVDQPGIRRDIIDRLIAIHRTSGAPIVAPRYGNMRGNPVLWDRSLFDELHTLSGDVGGREILRQHWREIAWLELDSEEELTDTDTPEEYQRLKEILRA